MNPRQTMIASTLALLIAGVGTPAVASPILYSFDTGTTVTDADHNVETITGSFYYDSSTDIISSANLDITGTSPLSGTFSGTNSHGIADIPIAGVNVYFIGTPVLSVHLFFDVADLSSGSAALFNPYPYASYYNFITPNSTPTDVYLSTSGGVSIAAVPEPSTISLLGFGLLGIFGMGYWARRKAAVA